MGLVLRLPNITAGTPEGQIQQLNSYLYQLVSQITWAFDHIEVETAAPVQENVSSPTRTFNSIKSLIIRDNDIAVTNLDRAYPVGAIYISASETDPANLFGFGTWERVKDTFLLAAGDTYAAGSTGGEAEHTLTVDEMPSHSHEINNPHTETGDNQVVVPETKGTAATNASSYTWQPTAEAGGSQPHNNMPPYLAVYVWKRTA